MRFIQRWLLLEPAAANGRWPSQKVSFNANFTIRGSPAVNPDVPLISLWISPNVLLLGYGDRKSVYARAALQRPSSRLANRAAELLGSERLFEDELAARPQVLDLIGESSHENDRNVRVPGSDRPGSCRPAQRFHDSVE